MNPAISIKNLTKTFKNFSLKNVNIEVPEGCIFGFVGRNGAGKTTLIKHLLTLMSIESGQIEMLGKDLKTYPIEIKQEIGFVLDDSNFLANYTAETNKKVISKFYTNWDEEFFQQLANRFQLNLKQKLNQFSKGQKTKFALALALAHHPKLLILDEPTSGLDPIFRTELLELLQEFMLERDCTIFFSTHITSDLDQIADYICMIDDGKIIFQKEKDDLLNEYRIIKGKKSDLEYWQTKALHLKVHDFGFEGLIQNKYLLESAEHEIVLEKATIQDIMVFLLRTESI